MRTTKQTVLAQGSILPSMCAFHGIQLPQNCLNIWHFGQAILAESSGIMFSPPHPSRQHHLYKPSGCFWAPRVAEKYQAFTLSWLKISGSFWVVKLKIISGRRGRFSTKNPKMDRSIFRCRVSFQECGVIWLARSLLSPDSRKASLPQSLVVDTPDKH